MDNLTGDDDIHESDHRDEDHDVPDVAMMLAINERLVVSNVRQQEHMDSASNERGDHQGRRIKTKESANEGKRK